MAPLESIIWEAKQKPGSLRDSRRPSTTVDETGCIITRGFVVPSRSSSTDSISRSSVSSFDTSGTPATPVDDPQPGYSRPTGRLYHSLELLPLRTQPPSALHRPSRSESSLMACVPARSTIGKRRETWQSDRPVRVTRKDDEFNHATHQPLPTQRQSALSQQLLAVHRAEILFKATSIKKSKSEQTSLAALGDRAMERDISSGTKVDAAQRYRIDDRLNAAQARDENEATTSDSEDDILSEDELDLARSTRATYTQRRARSDARAAACHPELMMPAPQETVPYQLSYSVSENAIESDDEANACYSDDKISARLNLARVHCSRNSLTARIVTGQNTQERRKSPLSVTITRPTSLTASETPREVKTFEPDAQIADRELQPSRSQPRPSKGVLKKRVRGSSDSTPTDESA